MQIVIPLYDRFTALDAVGPYEVLSRVPGAQRDLRRRWRRGPTPPTRDAHDPRRRARWPTSPAPRCSWCPAAPAARTPREDEALLGWIRARARDLRVDHLGLHRLAAARRGRPARRPRGHHLLGGHGDAREIRRRARPSERVVEQGKIVTAAGVSSGIDMALTLVARMTHERWPRRSSWASSTTPSRRSTPARRGPRRRRRSRSCARRSRRGTRRRRMRGLLYRPGAGAAPHRARHGARGRPAVLPAAATP